MSERTVYQGDLRGGVVLITRGPYNVEARDYQVLVDTTLGAITIVLPPARGLQGKVLNIKRVADTANAVTVLPSGAELIDGAASLLLASGLANAQLVAANNAWWIAGSITGLAGLALATLVTAASVVLTAAHAIVLVDSSGGNRTVTLPIAVTGTVYAVKKIRADANTVTLLPNGAETIDGAASFILAAQFAAVPLVGVAGTGWFIPW